MHYSEWNEYSLLVSVVSKGSSYLIVTDGASQMQVLEFLCENVFGNQQFAITSVLNISEEVFEFYRDRKDRGISNLYIIDGDE